MAQLLNIYDDMMLQADPRVDQYFLMSSPVPSLLMCMLYVYAVRSLGPVLMEHRKAFDLRSPMILYNFAMVIFNSYICLEFALAGWFAGYSYSCQPVDYTKSPQALRMVNVCWFFFFSKFMEFADTIFFVLRKKNNQISFLHVFHHGIMPISWWFGVKFAAGGFGTFHAMLNSFIHVVMYTYYGMSALGPAYHKYLWWKKYMTTMQIVQFIAVCVHTSQLIFIECNYPRVFMWWIFAYAVMFLGLFSDFYLKSYAARQTKGTESLSQENGSGDHARKKH